ncbi:MAG: electron transport complex subunit E [Lachnospiraceae bacterium]|nr:electron transport complex subunit E [Lachnospiraceae bacterium]
MADIQNIETLEPVERQQNVYAERLFNGLIKENPTFVLMLGMCPTLAVTSSAMNGLGMGLSTTAVLIFSNLLISMLRKIIPDGVRMPAFIVIVASLVTVVEFLMKAYLPALSASLGVYIPLIVVNCIILGRAESYASKNPVLPSVFDGIGMGLGFTFGLTCIGVVREILGAGQFFGIQVLSLNWFTPAAIFIMAPGAFLVLAFLVAIMNVVREKMDSKGKPLTSPAGCITGDCAGCASAAFCGGKSAISETTRKVNTVKKPEKIRPKAEVSEDINADNVVKGDEETEGKEGEDQ